MANFFLALLVPGLLTALGDFSGLVTGFIGALLSLFGMDGTVA